MNDQRKRQYKGLTVTFEKPWWSAEGQGVGYRANTLTKLKLMIDRYDQHDAMAETIEGLKSEKSELEAALENWESTQ